MTRFPEHPDDKYAAVYLEDTDSPLPEKINQSTRYAYFKTIARGGKSIIQSCKDLHLGRVICYKKLRPEFADDAIEQRRFLREARVSALLQHPNTVPTYEVGRDRRGHYYFTMKLVRGFTLRELLDEKFRDRYDMIQLMNVVSQVAFALEFAHTHRVIHRDIKPENILVGPFDEVLLMDWGLAKVWNKVGGTEELADGAEASGDSPVSSMTGAGQLQGTVAYMSPEQINRDPEIDFRTDIFSLGVVLYDILARRTPFVSDTVREMTGQILNAVALPPSQLTKLPVPPLLEALALRCIAKAPDERIGSCQELTRLLKEDWRSAEPVRLSGA